MQPEQVARALPVDPHRGGTPEHAPRFEHEQLLPVELPPEARVDSALASHGLRHLIPADRRLPGRKVGIHQGGQSLPVMLTAQCPDHCVLVCYRGLARSCQPSIFVSITP